MPSPSRRQGAFCSSRLRRSGLRPLIRAGLSLPPLRLPHSQQLFMCEGYPSERRCLKNPWPKLRGDRVALLHCGRVLVGQLHVIGERADGCAPSLARPRSDQMREIFDHGPSIQNEFTTVNTSRIDELPIVHLWIHRQTDFERSAPNAGSRAQDKRLCDSAGSRRPIQVTRTERVRSRECFKSTPRHFGLAKHG